jgi:hypothetical protein
MTFDVSQFELADTATLKVRNARGDDYLMVDGQIVTIEVFSPGSPEGVRALHRAGQLAAMRLNSVVRGEVSKEAAEEADAEEIEKLTLFTKSLNNFPIEGGARALYSNPRLRYIRTQVEGFLGKPGNFSKPENGT